MNSLTQFDSISFNPDISLTYKEHIKLQQWLDDSLPQVKYSFSSSFYTQSVKINKKINNFNNEKIELRKDYYNILDLKNKTVYDANSSKLLKSQKLSLEKDEERLANKILEINNFMELVDKQIEPLNQQLLVLRDNFSTKVSIESSYRFESARILNYLSMITSNNNAI